MKRHRDMILPAPQSAEIWELWTRPEATGGHWKFAVRGTYSECVAAMAGKGLEFNLRRAADGTANPGTIDREARSGRADTSVGRSQEEGRVSEVRPQVPHETPGETRGRDDVVGRVS